MLYKTEPWKHQEDALHFIMERNGMLAMKMGTGKTWVVVNLVVNREHQRTLVLCPISVMNVWPREFARHAATPVSVHVLKEKTAREKLEAAQEFMDRPGAKVLVVNYESSWRAPLGEWLRSCRPPWDLVVLDESHKAKGPTSKIGKYVDKLRINARQRVCLSGTPAPHSPLDFYSQGRFIDPMIFGRWYTHFRARYATLNPHVPGMVVGWINQEELSDKVASFSFQVGSEVLDLPPILHETRTIELNPRARKAYRELEEELITEIESGILTIPNALVKILRLQQVTSGYLPHLDGSNIEVLDTAKREALSDLLDGLPIREPVVVFCRYRADLETVRAVAEQQGRRYGELSGRRKDGLTDTATMSPDVDVLGTQISSGGVGIDLTRAAYVVYFSLSHSLGDYEQSLARAHRPGQTRTTHVYHLIAADTVDGRIYEALDKKREVIEYVMSAFKKETWNARAC